MFQGASSFSADLCSWQSSKLSSSAAVHSMFDGTSCPDNSGNPELVNGWYGTLCYQFEIPSEPPSASPVAVPSVAPTSAPSMAPTAAPSVAPSMAPTLSVAPTAQLCVPAWMLPSDHYLIGAHVVSAPFAYAPTPIIALLRSTKTSAAGVFPRSRPSRIASSRPPLSTPISVDGT